MNKNSFAANFLSGAVGFTTTILTFAHYIVLAHTGHIVTLPEIMTPALVGVVTGWLAFKLLTGWLELIIAYAILALGVVAICVGGVIAYVSFFLWNLTVDKWLRKRRYKKMVNGLMRGKTTKPRYT